MPWFEFTTECDAQAPVPASTRRAGALRRGRTRRSPTLHPHTLAIVAVDAAGNVSARRRLRHLHGRPDPAPDVPRARAAGRRSTRGSSLIATGLHISTGAIVDPVGRTWVADHNGGFCRVTASDDDGPGRIDHPELPGADGPRTCLGGLLPEAGHGPDAAGQPAFVDPTPDQNGNGDEVVLIPDGASPSSDVVRAKWNPDSDLFEYLTTSDDHRRRGARPVATSPGADGNVYVVFQRLGHGRADRQRGRGQPDRGDRRPDGRRPARRGDRRRQGLDGRTAALHRRGRRADPPATGQPTTPARPPPASRRDRGIGALAYDPGGTPAGRHGRRRRSPGSDVVQRINVLRHGRIERNYAAGSP